VTYDRTARQLTLSVAPSAPHEQVSDPTPVTTLDEITRGWSRDDATPAPTSRVQLDRPPAGQQQRSDDWTLLRGLLSKSLGESRLRRLVGWSPMPRTGVVIVRIPRRGRNRARRPMRRASIRRVNTDAGGDDGGGDGPRPLVARRSRSREVRL
jgi:hypothetical protein